MGREVREEITGSQGNVTTINFNDYEVLLKLNYNNSIMSLSLSLSLSFVSISLLLPPSPPLFLPQGFGVAAKSTQDCRHADPTTVIAFHQSDIGEYLRSEGTL